MKKIFIYLAISLVILPWVTRAIASDVSIQGDRLTLRADQVPLLSLLQRLADLGIKVRIDHRLVRRLRPPAPATSIKLPLHALAAIV